MNKIRVMIPLDLWKNTSHREKVRFAKARHVILTKMLPKPNAAQLKVARERAASF